MIFRHDPESISIQRCTKQILIYFFFALPAILSLTLPEFAFSSDTDKERTSNDTSVVFPHLPDIPGSHSYTETEPISKGKAFIYEAGLNNPQSIILIHGLGDEASRIWGNIVPELVRKYHVIVFDLPGFGRSSKQNILYSPVFYANFVHWVVERYARDKPLFVLGHSLGGGVALCYAALHPDNLKRLILVDASGVIHRQALSQHIVGNISSKHNGLLRFTTRLFGEIALHSLGSLESETTSESVENILHSAKQRTKFLNGESQKIAGLALANFNFSPLLDQIKVPAFIIWGADDPITPLRTGKILTHSLVKTKLVVLQKTGHNPILQKPKKFSSLLQDALVTESWEKPWVQPRKTNRVLVLSHKHNLTFSGHYQSITLSHCGNITLKNLETEFIDIAHCDEVVIENSKIDGKDLALMSKGSRIKMTGVHLKGDTAMIVSGSIVDLAAVEIIGNEAAVRAIDGSNLLFSVSKIRSPNNSVNIHGAYEITRENPL